MKKMLRRRLSYRWFEIELFVDESFRTHAKLVGATTQVPLRFRPAIKLLVNEEIEGIARINPQDSFDFRMGKKVAIHKLLQKLQTRVMKASKKLDDLWCGLFQIHNDFTG